jgi:HK97 family phage prohead protease
MDLTKIAPFSVAAIARKAAEGCPPDEDRPRNRTTFIASTDVVDRVGDIVEQDWQLEEFKTNPVVLWAHDSSSAPVGKVVDISAAGGSLVAEIEWDMGGERGAEVARQFAEGFLSAVSVGFIPGALQPRYMLADDDPRKADGGYVMSKNKLLEISAVPVPANAQALALRGLGVESDLIPAVRAMIARSIEADLTLDARIARAVEVAMGAVLEDAIDAALAGQAFDEEEEDFWADDTADTSAAADPLWPDESAEETDDFWSD